MRHAVHVTVSWSIAIAIATPGGLGCAPEATSEADETPRSPRAGQYRSPAVEQAVDAASDVVRTRGFSEVAEPLRGFLVEHSADVHEQAMRAGTCYVVLGAASAGVRELNVRVFDSDGGEVVQDTTTGPTAALRFCPSQSGTYFVAIQASAGSGLFELRTLRGPTGLEIRIDDLFRSGPEAPREGR